MNEFDQAFERKNVVTGTPMREQREITDPRIERLNDLNSANPDIFGTSQRFYPAPFMENLHSFEKINVFEIFF